jgi:hypothetical protein
VAVTVIELREEARLLEAELARQSTLSDSLDTRAGVAIGFAGLLAGLLVQVKNPNSTLRGAAVVALVGAFIALAAAFPRRTQYPDPEIVADLYEQLPEEAATEILSKNRLRAIRTNTSITESKRLLLTLAVMVLVVAIVMSALAVR